MEIAGEGKEIYLKKIAKKIKNGANRNIKLVGAKYDDDKWSFLKNADIFVLPTFSENFGIVVAEALAVGVPVITTQGTPWQELNTYNCGWCIELNVKNLESALQKAMNCTPDELLGMGQRGRKLIQENYDIKEVAKKTNMLYEWVAGKREQPGFVSID